MLGLILAEATALGTLGACIGAGIAEGTYDSLGLEGTGQFSPVRNSTADLLKQPSPSCVTPLGSCMAESAKQLAKA